MPDFEKDYWDLTKIVELSSPDGISYTDWEGMTSREDLEYAIAILRKQVEWRHQPQESVDHKLYEEDKAAFERHRPFLLFCADMTLHWVHAQIDQGDYTPTENEVIETFYAFHMLDSRYMMKSGIWDE